MSADVLMQALVVAVITAVCTAIASAYVSAKVLEAKLQDLKERITRIEEFLNGLLRKTP